MLVLLKIEIHGCVIIEGAPHENGGKGADNQSRDA